MLKRYSLAGALLASFISAVSVFTISIPAYSQVAISFKECADAVASVNSYATAGLDQAQSLYVNESISFEQFEQTTHLLEDFKNTYTVNHCMSGFQVAVFQCINARKGDLLYCR